MTEVASSRQDWAWEGMARVVARVARRRSVRRREIGHMGDLLSADEPLLLSSQNRGSGFIRDWGSIGRSVAARMPLPQV